MSFARTAGALLGGIAALGLAPAVLAHGTAVPPPPDLATFIFGWTFDPLAWLPAIVALLLWRVGVNRVNRAHPEHPVPRRRTVYWVAGVLTILYAIDSGLALYDTTLFSLHMVQHLLLTLVGPPLLAAGRPDHAAAPGVLARDAAAVHPAGPAFPAHAAGLVPRGRVDPVCRRHVGQPLLAAVQPRRSRTPGSTASSTCCS